MLRSARDSSGNRSGQLTWAASCRTLRMFRLMSLQTLRASACCSGWPGPEGGAWAGATRGDATFFKSQIEKYKSQNPNLNFLMTVSTLQLILTLILYRSHIACWCILSYISLLTINHSCNQYNNLRYSSLVDLTYYPLG